MTMATLDLSNNALQPIGLEVQGVFETLSTEQWKGVASSSGDADYKIISLGRPIEREWERFWLWAKSTGLFRGDHKSLDHRVRDSPVVKAPLLEGLEELKDHLLNFASIVLGEREPFHEEDFAFDSGAESDDDTRSIDTSTNATLFDEVKFRIISIAERIDSLHALGHRLRDPTNILREPTRDLYDDIPEDKRAEYQQNQESIEIQRVLSLHRRVPKAENPGGRLNHESCTSSHWLIRRIGKANARRAQQLEHRRQHAAVVGREVLDVDIPAPVPPEELDCFISELPNGLDRTEILEAKAQQPAPKRHIISMYAVTGCRLYGLPKTSPETRNRIAQETHLREMQDFFYNLTHFPPPPSHSGGTGAFSCPYCGFLCPEDYLSEREWEFHQYHDLHPFQCTYKDCADADRLYSTVGEWINHENQHRRIWTCRTHGLEFDTMQEIAEHTASEHPELEEIPDELSSHFVAASGQPRRECPLCSANWSRVSDMHAHMGNHLKHLALLVLPNVNGDRDPLWGAVSDGQVGDVQALVPKWPNFTFYRLYESFVANSVYEGGQTPLIRAADCGHTETARLLLDQGAWIDMMDQSGLTPLLWAVYHGHADMVRLLLERGAPVEPAYEGGRSPLAQAAGNGYMDIVSLLLERGARINAPDHEGITPLSRAEEGGYLDIASFLKHRGAV